MLDTIPRPGSPLPAHMRRWLREDLWAYPPVNAAEAEPRVARFCAAVPSAGDMFCVKFPSNELGGTI